MKSDRNRMPLYDALIQKANKNTSRFHVPGHKGGHMFHSDAYDTFENILHIDFTELNGLDDLHHPQEIIAQAQQLAAKTFHADETFFLVNGSTVGNLAMILATVCENDVVLVQRNSHKSVYNALSLTKARVVILEPNMHDIYGVPIGVTLQTMQEAVRRFPQAKACVLTYPNYYGMTNGKDTMQSIISVAHDTGMLVLVDEAHGAHFGMHESLPMSAMQLGADVSVQSTHKMLSSMTMSSMLHINKQRVQAADIAQQLSILQSSSPSYPLLASLDAARMHVEQLSHDDWEEGIEAAFALKKQIDKLEGFAVNGAEVTKQKKMITDGKTDPYKLIIQPQYRMNGFMLQAALEEACIDVEMADPLNVLLTLPIKSNHQWNERLNHILEHINELLIEDKKYLNKIDKVHLPLPQKWHTININYYRESERESVQLDKALDRIAADMITPYPPGIPYVLPGETLQINHLTALNHLIKAGHHIHGLDTTKGTIRVVNE